MNIIFFFIYLQCLTAYEADRIDLGHEIVKKHKVWTALIRIAVIIMAAENIWQVPSYFLLTAGLWSLMINYNSKTIKDKWYLGTESYMDRWGKENLTLYKIGVNLAIIGGITLMVLSYIYGEIPKYMISDYLG